MPIVEFLRDYWQKKPVLIRNVFASMENLISADELAGLALEEDVNSRLIIEVLKTHGTRQAANLTHLANDSEWQVRHGPFDENIFSQLPDSHWSLLVQHVDSLDPRVNEFLQNFRFIPNWRLDDIMISYATDKGGVGPHFDYYDVFLIQAEGRRRWRIGQRCDSHSALIQGQDMKLLQEFNTVEEWVVEPGDLLYVPAHIAHWGEAIGDSITYSVGFRAPSEADVLLDYAQERASTCSEDQRYQDPELMLSANPSAIEADAVIKLQNMLLAHCKDSLGIARWLGEYSTTLKQSIECMLETPILDDLKKEAISLSPYCRTAYIATRSIVTTDTSHNGLLFVNGQSWDCAVDFARTVSSYSKFHFSALVEREQKVVLELLAQNLICLA